MPAREDPGHVCSKNVVIASWFCQDQLIQLPFGRSGTRSHALSPGLGSRPGLVSPKGREHSECRASGVGSCCAAVRLQDEHRLVSSFSHSIPSRFGCAVELRWAGGEKQCSPLHFCAHTYIRTPARILYSTHAPRRERVDYVLLGRRVLQS